MLKPACSALKASHWQAGKFSMQYAISTLNSFQCLEWNVMVNMDDVTWSQQDAELNSALGTRCHLELVSGSHYERLKEIETLLQGETGILMSYLFVHFFVACPPLGVRAVTESNSEKL